MMRHLDTAGRRAGRGFSMVELLLAIVLCAIVLVAAAEALASSQQRLHETKNHDRALLLASNVLDRANTFGCGLGTGVATTGLDGTVDSSSGESTRAALCAKELNPEGPIQDNVSDDEGDVDFTTSYPQGASDAVSYQVQFRSSWRTAGQTQICDPKQAQPSLVQRTVTVSWTQTGVAKQVSLSAVADLPTAMTAANSDQSTGWALVDVPAGDPTQKITVTVTPQAPTKSVTFSKHLEADAKTDPATGEVKPVPASACVLLPFIPAGSQVSVAGAANQLVHVNSTPASALYQTIGG